MSADTIRFNKLTIPDWSSFQIAIVKTDQPSIHRALLKMEHWHQLPSESVMKYYYDKLHLCVQADSNMSSSMIIHYLIKGLNDSLLPHVIFRHPATANDFLYIAQDEETILLALNYLSYALPNARIRYPNEDMHMDHQVNVVKRPINVNHYSCLNFITQKHVYSLPHIDDVIERLNGSQIFSKLDLRGGYFHVPLEYKERAKTAFIASDVLWEFTTLP
ncbi:unnamed protein product [Rotaria sp. Silwood1]|nr:unnamed protein product [Rotaria sp. Silwood1]